LERRAAAARAAELARLLEDVSAGYGDDRPAHAAGLRRVPALPPQAVRLIPAMASPTRANFGVMIMA